MIIKRYNNGWGPQYALKRFEQELVDQYLAPISTDRSRTVVINSVWYSTDYHQEVMKELENLKPDRLVLVSMLDSAIVRSDWFDRLGCEVRSVGYYNSPDYVDFWALAVDRFFQTDHYGDLMQVSQIDTAYMCLNRKPHWHRVRLYQQLESAGILEQGIVSLGGEGGQPVKLLNVDQGESDAAPNPGPEQYGISNDIFSLGHSSNWKRHFLNAVTETVFDINSNIFVSEKIFKPILGMKPFLIYDSDGAVSWLEHRGFVSYVDDFRDITDLDLRRPESMAPFLSVLCQQGSAYWQQKFLDLSDKISYNKQQFYRYVDQLKQKITKGIQCQI